ncbi:MAG: response regulator [Planctomycetes bacterium]|nr:response regulator [Planctomycetota bacterium]
MNEPVRILVVDDEFGMREGCRRILSEEGYEVETAPDGLAGLDLFRERLTSGGTGILPVDHRRDACATGRNFAAALVDLKMPRMSGLELVEKLHALDPDTLILVITAYATIDTAVEATKRGAYGYIPKPFTPDELLLPVRNGLERRALAIEARRLRDERERRLLELAFERSKCSTVINCMTDGVLVVNRDGQVVLRNAAAARMVPDCAALPLPSPIERLACPPLAALVAEALHATALPMIVSRELALDKCTYMANASPVFEQGGAILGAVAVLRDITALKKLETAKSMFVSMVAHEVKGPLAAIEGYLNVVLGAIGGPDPQRDRRMLERSLLRAQALRTMVSELLNLAAMETGAFVVTRTPLDLAQVVAAAVDGCRERADGKHIALALHASSGRQEPVLADQAALTSIFTNLIDNAIKYTPENGHVDVSVEPNGMYAKVAVRDDGVGMAPEEKERAFDEFYRAKNQQTAQVPGTGLGLTIVKRLVEIHQGRVTVDTARGKGSTFTVRLPVVKQDESHT